MKIALQELMTLCGAQKTDSSAVAFPGESLFIRTVTYHLTGRVKQQSGAFLELEDAAWIADSGRFSDALKTGNLSEVEPVEGIVRVNIMSIVDIFEWRHPLPRMQK